MSGESTAENPAFWSEPDRRVPRVALMGEFSAGKSTLANLMIGTNPLPVQVVATQLPPVWITYGTSPSVIVDLEGGETPCDIRTLQGVTPEDTAFIKFYHEEEILSHCDIIDMPGISDPNMSSAVWERILPFADAIVWCTPATQAWRQSEAAVWSGISEEKRENSILVVTRADMLLNDRDRSKVFKRIRSETEGLFADVVMMSLTQAQSGEQDDGLWAQSGADAFVTAFMNRVACIEEGLTGQKPAAAEVDGASPLAVGSDETQASSHVVPRRPVLRKRAAPDLPDPEANAPDPASYMPKFS